MSDPLVPDHRLLIAALSFATTLLGGGFGVLKWHLARRVELESKASKSRLAHLVSFQKDVERLASEGKDTRLALRDHTSAMGQLRTDVAVLQVQMDQVQEVLPKALTLLEKINERFESRLPKKDEKTEIDSTETRTILRTKKENKG